MRAHPDLIRGPRAADSRLMKTLPGWIAKGGAEGLLCAAGDGIGVALKVEDGNGRAVGPAAASFFRQLDLDLGDLAVRLGQQRGERVGEIALARLSAFRILHKKSRSLLSSEPCNIRHARG